MDTFPAKLLDGHVIIRMNTFDYIVDTGSPFSFGRGSTIVIRGKTFTINISGAMGLTAESISSLSGLQVDGLIGMDILMHFDIRLTRDQVTFSLTAIHHADAAIKIPIVETILGVPVINLRIDHQDRRMFFDTGAKVSYLSEELLVGDSVGQMEDFYVTIGTYTTNIYKIDVSIGGTVETLTFGSLPSSIRGLIGMGRTKGIIGTELLKKYSLILSNSTRILILERCNEKHPSDEYESSNKQQSRTQRNLPLVRVRDPSLD